jgi:nitroreductase
MLENFRRERQCKLPQLPYQYKVGLVMDILEAITTRRSIRSFLKKDISEDQVRLILECGLRAPSSKNSNPWFFVVTRGIEKDHIADWIESGARTTDALAPTNAKTGTTAVGAFNSTAESVQTIKKASVLILVFNRSPLAGGKEYVIQNPREGRSLYTYGGEMIGIGAAVQNMLLVAHSLGLGGVYMADSYPGRVAVQNHLKTEAEMVGSLALGYPAYTKPPREVHTELVNTWAGVVENGIRTDNFTAKKEE